MKWSNVLSFFAGIFNLITGITLAIALLSTGAWFAANYTITKLTAPPPRPAFPNDKSANAPKTTIAPPKLVKAKSVSANQPEPFITTVASASPKPKLEPGAYPARVTQPIGLVLRDAPTRDSNQVGGVEFNQRVVVLEESADKGWQRIRVENGDRQGWVKVGNTQRSTP